MITHPELTTHYGPRRPLIIQLTAEEVLASFKKVWEEDLTEKERRETLARVERRMSRKKSR